MSNQGIRGFYQINETIKDQLLNDININTVTSGDIDRINLQKQDIFPLAHIVTNSVTVSDQVLTDNITVLVMDIVDFNKAEAVDVFRGNTNEQDILNTQLAVLNKLIQLLKRGSLHTDKYQLDADPVCEPFYDRFENELAGWSANMDIIIYNDINIC